MPQRILIKLKMEYINAGSIQLQVGKLEDEFDEAWALINWLDKYCTTQIREIIDEAGDHGLLNDKGKKVLDAIDFLTGWFATNKGVPIKHYVLAKRFDEWLDKHPHIHKTLDVGHTPSLKEQLQKMYDNNKDYEGKIKSDVS